jgi:hypothetical protein
MPPCFVAIIVLLFSACAYTRAHRYLQPEVSLSHATGRLQKWRRNYENLYRQENERRAIVVPLAEENEQMINQAISQGLDQMFQDKDLMNCLTNS